MRIFLLASLLLSHLGLAQDSRPKTKPSGMNPALMTEVPAKVVKWIEEEKLAGGIVLVAQNGTLVHISSDGLADRSSGQEMTPDTICAIHSMTKSITSTAAMMLWEEGKFQFDDPISKWIPAFKQTEVVGEGGSKPAKRPITVADLLRHTSGLTYGFIGGPVAQQYQKAEILSPNRSLEEMANLAGEMPLLFEPGTGWSYGISTDVLGRLVEIWSGQPYDEFLAARIFQPLGMNDTAFHVPAEKRSRLAQIHTPAPKSRKMVPMAGKTGQAKAPLERPTFCMPGGGLFSTATDYWKFLQMIVDHGEAGGKRYLKAETIRLMTSNQIPEDVGWISIGGARNGVGFGFGFSTVSEKSDESFDKAARLGEFGWGGAASCHYWVSPKDKLIVITLEQTMPYTWTMEKGLKEMIYEAVGE